MFTEQEMKIFTYHNGKELVQADPGRLHRLLYAKSDGLYGQWVEEWNDDSAVVGSDAVEKLLPLVCEVFGLQPYNFEAKSGMLEDEILDVLDSFILWRHAKKKSIANSQPCAPSSLEAIPVP